MSTIKDLQIQKDCATSPSVSGEGLVQRERCSEAVYFAKDDARKLAKIKARLKEKSCQCAESCNCDDCACGESCECNSCQCENCACE